MAQEMPLPLTISCCSKSRLVLTFWYLLTRLDPDRFQQSSKTAVCVCILWFVALFSLVLLDTVPTEHLQSWTVCNRGCFVLVRYFTYFLFLLFVQQWDFLDSEWQWHQLGDMQICTSLQTDNHASTPPRLPKGRKNFGNPHIFKANIGLLIFARIFRTAWPKVGVLGAK